MMDKRQGYTLLEMLIVVIIIGILATLGFYYLSDFDTNKYYAESCTNTIYGELSDYFYQASTSKLLAVENAWEVQMISPQQYSIQLDKQGNLMQTISFKYDQVNEPLSTITLATAKNCKKGKKYEVIGESNITKIQMLPNFKAQGNRSWIEMYNETKNETKKEFQATMIFKLCTPVLDPIRSDQCYDFTKILFDSRTGVIKKAFCKFYDTQDDENPNKKYRCKERSAGF